MSEHSLDAGIKVIEAIASLGDALGYTVRTESPVEQRANAPAVDVAWFADEEQLYPLMIFEVESAATNAMANNPIKVYGQPQEKFERPLFFFHIVVKAGTETTRIENLRRFFGDHNYRIYELDRGMSKQLVCDILSQHRRLHYEFNTGSCLSSVAASAFSDISPEFVVEHARHVGLRSRYLADLASLVSKDQRYLGAFLRAIELHTEEKSAKHLDLGYESYFGSSWSTPLHLAILVHSRRLTGEEGLQRLKWWQERSSYLSQIGPHFGLSRDYDLFVLGMAGGLWTLLANLMATHPPAIEYIAGEILKTLSKLEHASNSGSFYTAIWGLYVSAFCESDGYEVARKFLNERGGVPEICLYDPPAVLDLDSERDWLTRTGSPLIPVPSKQSFREEISHRAKARGAPLDPLIVSCNLLAFDDGTYEGKMPTFASHLSSFLASTIELPV